MERKIIYKENSEEYKAIKLLEKKTRNYSLYGEDLHYAIILYNLIINLMKENKKQQEIIDKAIEYINNSCYSPEFNKTYLDNLLQILEDKEV
jgi:hypothetical protein